MSRRYRHSTNYTIFRNILSKLRKTEYSKEISYLLIFTFLYKYCSDSLKEHYLSVIEDKEITLDEAFADSSIQEEFRNDAFHMFGYYINKSDVFMDEVINTRYQERFFLNEFIETFVNNVEFVPNSNYEKYFKFVFDSVKMESNLNKFEFDTEYYLLAKELIYSISKLELYDDPLSFSEVFSQICQSRAIRVDHDPDYITHLLTEIVTSTTKPPVNVYNPFLNDASSLIRLYYKTQFGYGYSYGKGYDRLTYCCAIINLLIHHFDLDIVYLEFENAIKSADINSQSFDIIVSKLPNVGGWKSKSINRTQNLEINKRNTTRRLENIISSSFDMNIESFSSDDQLKEAIENIVEKLDSEKYSKIEFEGEYESLKDNEYLFLINLINSLKDEGVMAVAISQSFLFKNSLEVLRKYLTYENNYLDAVISIPDELGRSSRPQIICVFKKNKANDHVLFVDLSQSFKSKKARDIAPGSLRRNLIFDDKAVKKLIEVYTKKEIIDRYSNVVTISEIMVNDFNLSVSRYVDTFEGEFIHLEDLANEKKEITSNIKKLNNKIDEMMEDLNIKFG